MSIQRSVVNVFQPVFRLSVVAMTLFFQGKRLTEAPDLPANYFNFLIMENVVAFAFVLEYGNSTELCTFFKMLIHLIAMMLSYKNEKMDIEKRIKKKPNRN